MTGGQARPGQARITCVPPMPPELRAGLCARHPRPSLWTSPAGPAERDAAIFICGACPALLPCRAWGLSLPASGDLDVILGGLTAAGRAEIRRERALRTA